MPATRTTIPMQQESSMKGGGAFIEKTEHLLPESIKEIGENFGPHRVPFEHWLFNEPPRTLIHGVYTWAISSSARRKRAFPSPS